MEIEQPFQLEEFPPGSGHRGILCNVITLHKRNRFGLSSGPDCRAIELSLSTPCTRSVIRLQQTSSVTHASFDVAWLFAI
ncbi:hypothetical protein [Bradyrhizobium cenepequi]